MARKFSTQAPTQQGRKGPVVALADMGTKRMRMTPSRPFSEFLKEFVAKKAGG